jgi:hypothetical protein
VSDLLKIPSQKEKLVQAIDPPSNTIISSNKVVPSNKVSPKEQERVKEQHEDPPVVLTSRDRTKEENPPFFVSLEINDQWLHNYMYDSGVVLSHSL